MQTIRIAAVLAAVAMVAVIAYGIASGGFTDDAAALWALPWGRVTLVDLAAGFVVVGAIIVVRERDPFRWLPWLVGLLVLGNLVTALYVLYALGRHPRGEVAP